jgi:hypothetical protein
MEITTKCKRRALLSLLPTTTPVRYTSGAAGVLIKVFALNATTREEAADLHNIIMHNAGEQKLLN